MKAHLTEIREEPELKTVDRVLLSGLAFCSNSDCRVAVRLKPLPPEFSLDF